MFSQEFPFQHPSCCNAYQRSHARSIKEHLAGLDSWHILWITLRVLIMINGNTTSCVTRLCGGNIYAQLHCLCPIVPRSHTSHPEVPMARPHFPCPICSTPPVSRRTTDRSQGSRAKDGSGPRSSSHKCLATAYTRGVRRALPNAAMRTVLWLAGLGIQEKKTSASDNLGKYIFKQSIHFWQCRKNALIICSDVASPMVWTPGGQAPGVPRCPAETAAPWWEKQRATEASQGRSISCERAWLLEEPATVGCPFQHPNILQRWYDVDLISSKCPTVLSVLGCDTDLYSIAQLLLVHQHLRLWPCWNMARVPDFPTHLGPIPRSSAWGGFPEIGVSPVLIHF